MADYQLKIETSKTILTQHPRFTPIAGYFEIDVENAQILSIPSIQSFLDSHGIHASTKEIGAVLSHWDVNADGRVDVDDFTESVISDEVPSLKATVRHRGGNLLPKNVTYSLAKLIESEVIYFRETETAKAQLAAMPRFNNRDVWNNISNGEMYISSDTLYTHVKKQGGQISKHRLDLLFKRLDQDRDGKVSMFDLSRAIKPERIRDKAPDYSDAVQKPLELHKSSVSMSMFPKIKALTSKYESPLKDPEPSYFFQSYLQQKVREKILQYTPREKSAAKMGSPSTTYSPMKRSELSITPSPDKQRSTVAQMFNKPLTPGGSMPVGNTMQELLDSQGFSPAAAFRHFDTQSRGYLNRLDLESGLDRLQVTSTHDKVGRLFLSFSINNMMTYADFIAMILPPEYDAANLEMGTSLTMASRNALRRVFQSLINTSVKTEEAPVAARKMFGELDPNALETKKIGGNSIGRSLISGYMSRTPIQTDFMSTLSSRSGRLSP